MSSEKKFKEPEVLFLALLAALPSIFAVLFTPALPAISADFQIPFSRAQYSMVFYLLGYSIGQLPYGPLSNRFGRKKVLYLGLLIAIASSLLSAFAGYIHNFPCFVIGRFFTACGACAGLNIAYTVIGDLYKEKEALRVLSFIMLLSAVLPGLATMTGGIIANVLNWPWCFYFLAVFGILMMILSYYQLPETSTRLRFDELKFSQIVSNYTREFKNNQLLLSAIITGSGASMIYLFATTAPFFGINIMGLNPEQFGYLSMLPSLGLVSGSLITRLLTGTHKSQHILASGAIFIAVVSIGFFILFYWRIVNIWTLFVPMLFINMGLAAVFATTATFALTNARNKSIGSSLMNFINLGMCVISALALRFIQIQNPIILPLIFGFLSLIFCLLILKLIGERKKALLDFSK